MPWCQLKHLPTMKSVLQVILTMLLATSCSIYKQYPLEEEYNQSWKGRSYGEIVAEFGAPDRVEYDGIDGRILVYEEFISTAKTEIDTHFGRFDPDSIDRYVFFADKASDVGIMPIGANVYCSSFYDADGNPLQEGLYFDIYDNSLHI